MQEKKRRAAACPPQTNQNYTGAPFHSFIVKWVGDHEPTPACPFLSWPLFPAFETRETAKALLESAKRAVEIAIEQDEATAEAWIKSEAQRLRVIL